MNPTLEYYQFVRAAGSRHGTAQRAVLDLLSVYSVTLQKKSESRLDRNLRDDRVRTLRMTTALNNVKWTTTAMPRVHAYRVVITTGGQEGPN